MGDPGEQGPELIAQICMLKNVATRAMQSCADAAVQTFRGMDFMLGPPVE